MMHGQQNIKFCGANSHMFRHQGAIIRELISKELEQVLHSLFTHTSINVWANIAWNTCKVYKQHLYFVHCPLFQKTQNKELSCSATGSVTVFVSSHCGCWRSRHFSERLLYTVFACVICALFFFYFGRWKIGVRKICGFFLWRSLSGFYSSIIETTVRFVNILL